MIGNGTFGSFEEYKMLDFLSEKINELDKNRKRYISHMISDYNKAIKNLDVITDFKFKCYLLDLVYFDYWIKITEFMTNKYDEKIITYLNNYFYAKKQNAKQK